MSTFDEEAKEEGHYDVSDNDDWKPCIFCGGDLTQERKAFFVCVNCKQTYIADEQDMRRDA